MAWRESPAATPTGAAWLRPGLTARARVLVIAWSCAAIVALPVDVRAAPSEPTGPDVGALWSDANAKLATGDYADAIEQLTRVFEAVANDPEARALRIRVRMALHDAHRGAHRLDGQAEHLLVAREVLQNGAADFGPGDAEARARSDAAIAELDVEIAALERAALEREAEARAAEQRQAEAARAAAPPVVTPAPIPAADVPPQPAPRGSRGYLIGAGIAGGIGVIGLGLLAGGFGSAGAAIQTFEDEPERRDDARGAIRRGNALGIAGAVLAGVGLTTAAILVPLGVRARKGARPIARVVVGGGLGVRGRF